MRVSVALRVFVAVDALAILAMRFAHQLRTRKAARRIVKVREIGLIVLQAVGLAAGSITIALFVLLPAVLETSFLPVPSWVRHAGAALGAAFGTMAVAILGWSHHALGTGFTALLGVRDAQQLVRTGPYGLVRHPMYAAFILQALGFFLLTTSWLVAAAWSPLVLSLVLRMPREEDMMVQRFGVEYQDYRNRTRRLLPRVRHRKGQPLS